MNTAALPYSHGYAGIGQAKAPIETESIKAKDDAASENKFWGDDGFSFGDLIDLINPLQHLPIVSTIYRTITNDQIAPGPRMAGGAIFGGPLGFVSALANTLVEEATGKDVGEHLVALAGFGDDDIQTDAGVSVAGGVPTNRVASAENLAPTLTPTEASAGAIPMTPAPPPTAPAPAGDKPSTHAVRRDALAKYENTVWGALLAAQQSGGTGSRQPLRPLPLPTSLVTSDEKPASSASDTTAETTAAWQVEHLSAQELAERLLLYTQAFETNGAASNRSTDQAY